VQEDDRRTLERAADATVVGAELGDIALVEVVASLIAVSSHRLASRTTISRDPRSWSQYQLAAGVALFELPVRVPHIVEGEDCGDRHLQLTACDEVSQLGDHRCGRGIRTACRLDPEPLHGFEVGDGGRPWSLGTPRSSTAMATYPPPKKIQQGVDVPDGAAARNRAGRSSP